MSTEHGRGIQEADTSSLLLPTLAVACRVMAVLEAAGTRRNRSKLTLQGLVRSTNFEDRPSNVELVGAT